MGRARCTLSNPSASLTDFSLLIDLSRMPAEWWAEANTDDATRGRAYKGDGTTRLAVDWIAFNRVAKTGFIRINWAGGLASTGTQQVVIEPPLASRATVSAVEPYGQYGAYDSYWRGYWPLNTSAERTQYQNHLTSLGGLSFGGAQGPIGAGTRFTRSSSQRASAGRSSAHEVASHTLLAWCNPYEPVSNSTQIILSKQDDVFTGGIDFGLRWSSDDVCFAFNNGVGGPHGWYESGGIPQFALTHVSYVVDFSGSPSVTMRRNAMNPATLSIPSPSPIYVNDELLIGWQSQNAFFDGVLAEIQLHSTIRTQSWIAYEYQQTSNQTGSFGTWTYEESGPTPHDLTAVGITTGTPVLGTPMLGQTHSLSASGIITGPAVLSQPVLGQSHSLQAQGITTGTPVLGTPALSSQSGQLVAIGITTGPAVLGTPALGQSHALIAVGITTGAAVLSTPALSQTTALTPVGITTGPAVLGNPALSQSHTIEALGVATGPAELGLPALGQTHKLTALGITTGAAVLGRPAIINANDYQGEVLQARAYITQRLSAEARITQRCSSQASISQRIQSQVRITERIHTEVEI